MQTEATNFFTQNQDKFFSFVQPLIKKLSATHDIYFITGEPEFVAKGSAQVFTPKGYISSKLEVKNDTYTGKVATYLATRDEKHHAIQHLVKKYDMHNSFAFGDSEGDIHMLNQVQNAVCINATDGLRKEATKNDWHITTPDKVEILINTLI